MSHENVTPIRSGGGLSPKLVEHIQRVRNMVFQAQSITQVAAAAAVSETPADDTATETTLELAAEILDRVADMLDPINLARAGTDAEVNHG